MWFDVDVAGRLTVTGLHSGEDGGHTHLERGGGGQGLSCVDTVHFTLIPGVWLCFSQLRSAGGRSEHQGNALIVAP